jgi:hypothetical protein
MNCAVVDIVKRGTKTSRHERSQRLVTRDTAKVNAVAQAALSSYPDLFVANLASINKCVAPETFNVVFDDPRRAVAYGDKVCASSKPSFGRGACTGRGRPTAPTTVLSVSPPPPGGSGSSSNSLQSSTSASGGNDGQWHPDLHGGSTNTQQTSSQHQHTSSQPQQALNQPQRAKADLQPVDVQSGLAPCPEVEKELNAYLASLYGGNVHSKRNTRQKRWASYQASTLEPPVEEISDASAEPAAPSDEPEDVDADPPAIDPMLAACLMRLNSVADTLFTLVKFATT